ncbi:hypothetical protein COOONC_08929 [Cooperia oncophora]
MRLLILALLVAVCVSADLLDLKKSLAVGSLKGLIKEKVTSKIKKTMDRIKEVFNGNMLEFRKKLSGYKDAILKKLTLSPEQRKELVERLKMFKRKTIDQVSPAGDSIEEINLRSQIAGALFQGDMVLSKEQQDQIAADVSGTRTKRQTYNDKDYPGRRWTKGVNYFFRQKCKSAARSLLVHERKKYWQQLAYYLQVKRLRVYSRKRRVNGWIIPASTSHKAIPVKLEVVDDGKIPLDAEISAQDSIRVFMEDGCWSFVGRLGGVQNLSLGEGCDSVCFNEIFLLDSRCSTEK